MCLLEQLPTVRGTYRESVELSKTNWFGVGGKADILFRPKDPDDLKHFLSHIPETIPVTVIGVGSNLLVRDGGVEGVVIRLGREFSTIRCNDTIVTAGAGALSYNTALCAQQAGITGLEFLCGIPGTIGGALAMNAGAYNQDTASILITADVIDEHGVIHTLNTDDIGFIYRGNTLPEHWIFIQATLQGQKGNPVTIKEHMDGIMAKREASQPIRTRTSGSTFANPPGKKAWELIDQAGCRGLRIGGAIMSEKHCNFMINEGKATAADLEQLAEEVRTRVKEKTGVTLQWEVRCIGRPLHEQKS